MGRWSLLFLTVIAFGGNQDPARPDIADETPLFRTGTRLVQVDVIVRGKDAPINGLTKDDFEVTDNGKRQPISIFAVRSADRTPRKPLSLPAGAVTNRPLQNGVEPVTATVIMIDRLNTAFGDQAYARAQALKYMQRAGNNEQFAIYSLNQTFKVIQDFTDDREVLRRAVERSSTETTVVNTEILDGIGGNAANAALLNAAQRKTDITTAAFRAIARHLKGLPGRKKLVWISSALPLTVTQDNQRNDANMQEFTNLSPPLFQATRALNDANVAIYSIDPRGVFPGVLMDPNIAAMVQLTGMTGGRAFYARNDLDVALEEAVLDTDLTYTLGFYQTEGAVDGEFHSVSVKVLGTRPETKDIKEVRYRRGYNAEVPRTPLTDKQRKGTLNAWVSEPLDATEIGIQAAAVPAKNRPNYYDVEVAVDIAGLQLDQKNGRWVGLFELAIVPDVDNKPKGLHQVIKINLTQQNYVKALTTGITVLNQVKVASDKGKLLSKRLHLVVMDGVSGKSGSVRIPLGP